MKSFCQIVFVAFWSVVALPLLAADSGSAEPPDSATDRRQYTFSWPFEAEQEMSPRGGITQGPAVELDRVPAKAWRALQQPDLSSFERDRRAILAMAGPYRTSFDFIETVGFAEDYRPDRPYQSWATEYVYVIEDTGDFISLQHILVMYFELADGVVSEPMVVKHWRQDWRYQDRDLHVYRGHRQWQRQRLSEAAVAGSWSQAVFQVDDSPRYEAVGRWVHYPGYSSWLSADTWRPLPRREFSVRDDYQVLAGSNRHTITPDGWVHGEDNLKIVVANKSVKESAHESAKKSAKKSAEERAKDGVAEPRAVIARELGLNRYQRIKGHSFAAGDAYWQRTELFWRDVRRAWRAVYRERDHFSLRASVAGQSLFEIMFDYADQLDSAEAYDSEAAREFIEQTLQQFLQD